MSDLIQGLWIGRELSLMEQLSIKSFIANGHCYHLYTYEDVKNVPPGTIVLDANTIVPREQIFALKHGHNEGSLTAFANLFRFKLLFEKSGWWVDLDLVCLKRFDFSAVYVITSECDEPDGYCGPSSAVLKTPKGDEFIGACLSKTLSLCSNPESLNFGDTGYKLVREMVAKYNLDSFVQSPETFAPVAKGLPHQPLDAVAVHGARRNLAADDDADPGLLPLGRLHEYAEVTAHCHRPAGERRLVSGPFQHPRRAWQRRPHTVRRQAARGPSRAGPG
jgi:hypothetical protein